jgi:hypothetical protein
MNFLLDKDGKEVRGNVRAGDGARDRFRIPDRSRCGSPLLAPAKRRLRGISERLTHVSLLIMAGDTQKNFKHEGPRERGVKQARINLTFRRIEHK